ncbi:MAG TPA: LysR family transcriptional regulator [Pusillimonas sp.]|uniref:LysR family transcriptional regulator n=1 Tax=Pusillimonas sp. TaxID=3040095 RepID=UPI002BE99519|nr:LysR family transcriptional regulator [Pusillimonas sp.]HUH86427.1 LysR family transcriptional regulator [Pusillimonas sp.]
MKTDLNLLRVLLAIHETGSVTAAAQRLGISQPAASAALGRLRRALGDPLFVRRGLNMHATPLAQGILGKTREVIDIIDHDILAPPTFDPAGYTGEVVLCLSEIGEVVLLPALYRSLRKRAPGLVIKTISLGPEELDQAMHDGRVDMAIGYFPDLTSADIYQQRLFSHVLACMVRQGHPVKGSRMTLAQFRQAEHLLVRDGSRTMEMYEQHILSQGIQRKVGLRMSHYMSVPGLVEESDLVVVLPRIIAEQFARSAALRVLEPPAGIPHYDLKQYWHRRYHHDPRIAWLRKAAFEIFEGYLQMPTKLTRDPERRKPPQARAAP